MIFADDPTLGSLLFVLPSQAMVSRPEINLAWDMGVIYMRGNKNRAYLRKLYFLFALTYHKGKQLDINC